MNYLAITTADAALLAAALRGEPIAETDRVRLLVRLTADTGGDMDDVAHQLKHLDLCAACHIEAQERLCNVPDARKLGRRLARWLARAAAGR